MKRGTTQGMAQAPGRSLDPIVGFPAGQERSEMKLNTANDFVWWDLLRANCQYRNGYGKCINRPRKNDAGYVRCESQGCPLLRKPNDEVSRK